MIHVALCGPMSLKLLQERLDGAPILPRGYEFPFMAYLACALLGEGLKVTVITSCSDVGSISEWRGKDLHVIATPRRCRNLYFVDAYRKEVAHMRRAIRAVHPDIVHANWTYEFADAAISSGFPHLVTAHDSPWTALKAIRNVYTFYRTCYASCHVIPKIKNISFVSDYIQSECAKYHRLPHFQYVIPNGIQTTLCVDKPHAKVKNVLEPKFVCVSGGGRLKNVPVLLEAFRLVKQKHPRARLVVVGLSECGRIVKGVDMVGRLPHDQVLRHLDEADIYVNTTLNESFCMSVLEAMARGLPCIAGSSSGAVPWLFDGGKAGLLVDVASSASVAQGMVRLIDDATLYQQLGRSGLERAKHSFLLNRVAGHYHVVYQEILSRGLS
jgi:glycosyltransferase involved in cell wall biosynthesis